MKNLKIILASQSPRRRELMEMLGIPFEIKVSDTDEIVTDTDPAAVTIELSRQKAAAVAALIDEGIVIGADTVVAWQGEILGKPRDREQAVQMITNLQGGAHMVYTGVTIWVKGRDGESHHSFAEGTKVRVSAMSEREIEDYVQSGEPYDKAGGYGIQGVFGKYVEGIEGDYYNVVGLPVHRLYDELKKLKFFKN